MARRVSLLPLAALLARAAPAPVQGPAPEPRASVSCPDALFTALRAANFSDPDVLHLHSDADFGLKYQRYNLELEATPCAVLWVRNTNDVAEAVKAVVKSNTGIHVQGRSGGHSYANYGLGGTNGQVSIYLPHMTDYSYDPATGYATIGTGFTLGDFTNAMANNGRMTAHGLCPQVGVGGHATIGGLGYSSRMYGPLLDQLVQATVVIANGSVVTASSSQNSDLLWALKGAGASFGVITQMVIKTYPLQPTTQYSINFSLSNHSSMTDLFYNWQQFLLTPNLDKRFSSLAFMSIDSMIITGNYYGTIAEYDALGFEAALGHKPDSSTAVLRSGLGAIEQDFQQLFLQVGGGMPTQFVAKSLVVKNTQPLTRDAIAQWFAYMDNTNPGTEAWFVIADAQGGQSNEVAQDATAYPHRDTLWMLQSYSIAPLIGIGFNQQMVNFLNGQNAVIQKAMPDSTFLAYAGYVDESIDKTLYWGPNYPRLLQVKQAWDPKNVFANPQSVGAGL